MIGRNGAGKSTLLKILTQDHDSDRGARDDPRAGRQPPRGRHRLPPGADRPRERLPQRLAPRDEAARDHRKFPEIVEFAGVDKFIDTPVKRYSSGMSVRLAFAVAALSRARDPARGRSARRRGRRVPAPLSRANGGPERVGSHRALRLAQHAGCRTALRPRDPARRRPDRQRRAERTRSWRSISRPATAAVRAERGATLDDAPGDELVRLRSARVLQEGAVAGSVDVRKPVGIEIVVHGAATKGSPSSRRSRSSTGRATSRSTRWTRAHAGRSRPRRASTSLPPGSPATCSTRA